MSKIGTKILDALKYIKLPYLKKYFGHIDTTYIYKSLPYNDSLTEAFESIKSKAISGSAIIINSSRDYVPKLIDDIFGSFTSSKEEVKRPPRLTLEELREKTINMLDSLKQAEINFNRHMRLEELLQHILEFPDSRRMVIKRGGIAMLLKARASANDYKTEEIANIALAAVGYSDPPNSSGIRILSIDGGGMRGLAALQILNKIEKITGRRIADLFDFICGVSTGAIITSCLIPPNGLSTSRISELYMELSRKVFTQNAILGTGKLFWNHAYYDSGVLETFIREYVGDHELIRTNRYQHCPKIAMISTLINESKMTPFLFRNYAEPCYGNSIYKGSHLHTMFQAVRASVAAPTIFEEFKAGDNIHQDGGISVNNPAAIALHEARTLWPNEGINCIVSVGTGIIRSPFGSEKPKELGNTANYTSWKQILEKILQSATDTEGVHRVLNDLLPKDTYFRLNPYLSQWIPMDETDENKLHILGEDTKMYCRRRGDKLYKIAKKLTEERPYVKKAKDYIVKQLKFSKITY